MHFAPRPNDLLRYGIILPHHPARIMSNCLHRECTVRYAFDLQRDRDSMMKQPDHPFWEFSLRLYARPGVAEASLALQDRFDADVNMLFFMLWAADNHRALSTADIRALIAQVQPWRDNVVRPLRIARRHLKTTTWKSPETDDLRQRIQAQELDAERMQQFFLERQITSFHTCESAGLKDCAIRNVANYAAAINAKFPDEQVSVLLTALEARS